MNEASNILKNAREEKRYTQKALAEQVDTDLRTIQRYEQGVFPKYKNDTIKKIDEILGTNIYDIVFHEDKPKPDLNKEETYIEKRRNLKNNKQHTLTYYDIGAAAGPVGDIFPVKKSEGVLHISDLFKRSQFAIRISGNSMMPNYPPGSIVGIREMETNNITPGVVYVIETQDELRIKRLFYKDDNQDSGIFECVSDNTMRFQNGGRDGKLFYPPFYVRFEDVRRLFKVTGIYKANELSVIS